MWAVSRVILLARVAREGSWGVEVACYQRSEEDEEKGMSWKDALEGEQAREVERD